MRSVLIVPTYNEAANIEKFLTQVRTDAPDTDILVVDDNSPDQTAKIAETLAAKLGSIKVLNRTSQRGYAAASREAMLKAVESGYDVIATMDADFSHDPKVLTKLISIVNSDIALVIGSRYVPGGGVTNWSLFRRLLSKWGNLYTAFCLRLKIKDCTSGFRAYSAASLKKINLDIGTGLSCILSFRQEPCGGFTPHPDLLQIAGDPNQGSDSGVFSH